MRGKRAEPVKRRVGVFADAEIRTDAKAVDVGEGADVTKIAASLLAFFLSLFALPSSLLALPSSLSPLDGLQFNGSNWIATGYCPTASDRFECDVTVADAQVNASSAVFGTVREGEPDRTFAFYVRQNGDDSSVVAYGDTARGSYFPRTRKVSLSVGPDGATWTWPGGSDRLALTPGFARDGVTPLLIGDANGSSLVGESVPAGMGAVMKLHRFRIWYGGLELLHDYVPCTDQNGQYGVYDEVGRAFLPCGRKIGFAVNGKDIGRWWKDAGWTYSNGLLSLTNATGYVLSGVATNGEVQVKATTEAARVVLSNAFVFTSGRQAIEAGQDKLTVAAGQVMMTGNTPKTLRHAQSYNGEPCVLVARAVTVTVKDIPHVTGFTVSNAVEKIEGGPVYRVMAGDDVFVGYTVEEGYYSKSPNPLVYPEVASNVTVDAGAILVLHKAVPITPGVLSESYATAEKATNAMGAAFIDPRDDVAAVLGTGALLESYRNMFGFAVTGGGGDWFVEAVLTPTARTNLAATVTSATRQIPVGAIARLPDASAIAQHPEIVTLTVTTNVTVRGCAPGFFYSLYDGWALTNIVADANVTNLNVLCGADAKVTFPELMKPSEKAGFFRVGVGVTDNVGK